jgi:osmotically-inducible protein OsmY
MSERDRQNPYDRSLQHGSGNRGNEGYDPPHQANQWQSDTFRQQGGDWQQDGGQRGSSDDDYGSYRFSGQGNSPEGQDQGRGGASFGQNRSQARYGAHDEGQRSSPGGSYRSGLSDDDLRNDQRQASRNFEQARGGYGQGGRDQNWQRDRSQGLYGQGNPGQSGTSGYAGRDFDASGGNNFASFTSEDFGGRDFYNRGGGGGGVSGGARSSESYRPSYGPGSWFSGDDDRQDRSSRGDQNRGHEDYGSWRQYGESRGFLARAGDEVASWFGDEDASRRREQDHRQQGQSQRQSHRGRGPANYTRSDERIREDANDHLTHDHDVDASHITVSVKDGELTLDGTVDSRQAKRRAEDCVEHISGVKHVQNNLRVQERSAATSSGGATGGASSTYGQSSELGLTGQSGTSGHSTGSASTSGTGSSGSGTTGAASAGSTGVGSASTSQAGSGTTGTQTTGGIGSTATAGAGTSSGARASDKTS